MRRWDIMSLPASSEKRRPREPGANAPRVPKSGVPMPLVLFSAPECRVVVLELENGETMGAHQVHERAIVQVITGRVLAESSGEAIRCDAGALVIFEPDERHTLHALADARLLLILAPWPAADHYSDAEKADVQHLPINAMADPITSTDTVACRDGAKRFDP
jgi:quercetin dioxygenase-like cupin family protein